MGHCTEQFKAFDDRIRLNPARRSKIDAAVKAFADFCASDPELRAAAAGPVLLQGSVATRTVVKPLKGDDYDVDVIYPFRTTAFRAAPQAREAFNWFKSRVAGNPAYHGRLVPKNRCLRIEYAGEFHVDLIPSATDVANHQPHAVPARDLSNWITNDPVGFADWLQRHEQRSGLLDGNGDGVLVRSIRMMKRWRDEKFGAESAVSSILLVVLLGKHEASQSYTPQLQDPLFASVKTDAAYLYDLLRITESCIKAGGAAAFLHPTIRGEDLSRGWAEKHLPVFLDRLGAAIDGIRAGIYATRDSEATHHFRSVFGDAFPAA